MECYTLHCVEVAKVLVVKQIQEDCVQGRDQACANLTHQSADSSSTGCLYSAL